MIPLGFPSVSGRYGSDPATKKEAGVQLKLFDRKLADLAHLEADINQWLATNPKLITIQRDFHVYHNHVTKEESILVAMWYEPKSSL